MGNETRTPERLLNYTKKAKEVVEKIDDSKFLSLHLQDASRSELFLYAMALGLNAIPKPLQNIYSGGLVQDKSIDYRTKALMYAYYISKMPDKSKLDIITNKEFVYKVAEEYANTGFEILDDYMNQNKKDTDLIWTLLSELDKQYNHIFSK